MGSLAGDPTGAVLADGILIEVHPDDHLIRHQDGQWICVRPRHAHRDCEHELLAHQPLPVRPAWETP